MGGVDYSFDFSWLPDALPVLWRGAFLTVQILVWSAAISLLSLVMLGSAAGWQARDLR